MKLIKFEAIDVNGYLNFGLDFFEDLTFLTGINGTGKTSALNAMSALLMPKLDYLASHSFAYISLTIGHQGEKVMLSAEREKHITKLSCSLYPEEPISFEAFSEPDTELPRHKLSELEEEYYKELLAKNANSPILSFIEDLPTPMFLGLDRRSRSFTPDRYWMYSSNRKQIRRNVFGNSLNASLREAMYFANDQLRNNERRKFLLDRNFRDKLVLELLNFPPVNFTELRHDEDIIDEVSLSEAKKNIYKIPKLLRLPYSEITSRIEGLFTFIEEQVAIVRNSPPGKEDEDDVWEAPILEARFAIAQNKANIEKINTLSRMVSEYTAKTEEIDKRTNEFAELINSFIKDSGKILVYTDDFELAFRVGEESAERDLTTLSSGEIQIIVIFAHLYFNPETNKANVFIIDEPELSLHVQWQQKFVDALLEVTENTQFIMATHSPTIIMNRIKNCKEISRQI
ncbi:AAA family ATPase [Oceaniglobus ichthyenteri]|uniref:AAA family ATPase n=1 Tax=Oceaniglobus ichthyenteri TaxID=2136177 RepID=UPI000D39DE9A|nr:AAA family ATPase [Oceaniglobus ichthyenteri]